MDIQITNHHACILVIFQWNLPGDEEYWCDRVHRTSCMHEYVPIIQVVPLFLSAAGSFQGRISQMDICCLGGDRYGVRHFTNHNQWYRSTNDWLRDQEQWRCLLPPIQGLYLIQINFPVTSPWTANYRWKVTGVVVLWLLVKNMWFNFVSTLN